MNKNIERFGKLTDAGDSGDGKRAFVNSDKGDGWQDIRIEIDTDDCDSRHARAFKKELIKVWNSQG